MSSDPTTGLSLDFSGSPNASVYAEQAATAQHAYQQALTNVATKRAGLYNQTGFKVQNNDDGTINNYSVDGLNPTGAYQQLQKSEGMRLEAQHEADASRNIGTRGIGAQGTSNLRYANGVEQANFGSSFLGQNQGLVDEQANARGTLTNSLLQLQLQAIADARNSTAPMPKEDAGGDGGGDNGGGGTSTSPATQALLRALSQPTQAKPGGIAVDKNGGYYDPMTSRYYAAGTGPGAASAKQLLTKPTAVKVAANKTGASANQKQGIFAIH